MISALGASDLRDAIADGDISVVYQPLVGVRSGRLARFEALCRWTHADRGRIAPAHFIPLAEETDLITPLTLFVARDIGRQLRALRVERPDLRCNLNLSVVTLLEPGFPERLTQVLEEVGCETSALGVEVTESAFMRDPGSVARALEALRGLGLRIEVDDFGTGYSSLARLVELPIDALKIDRRFVGAMSRDHRGEAIVRATIQLAHDLGLEAVGEGVEDRETWELLRALGCDTAQGYHLAPPMPADDMAQWCGSWDAGLEFMERSHIGRDLVDKRTRGAAKPDVLVVDDEPAILELIRAVLEDDGFRVVTAANGAEALREVDETPPAVVLLDMQMPMIDGAAFVRALRKRHLDVPVVVMTAGPSAARWARELGVQGYLSKPFDIDDLLKVTATYARRN